MEQFTPVPTPEGWLLPPEWQRFPPAAVLVPLVLSMAETLRSQGDECKSLAERALTLLREQVIVFREEQPPADDE